MKKRTNESRFTNRIKLMIAVFATLTPIILLILNHYLSREQPTLTTDVPPTALEVELSKANILLTEVPGKENQVRQWLLSDERYQVMAQTIIRSLTGKRVNSPIPLDVIVGKYRTALGKAVDDPLEPDAYKDMEIAKIAMFETWKERHPDLSQKTIDGIVETIK